MVTAAVWRWEEKRRMLGLKKNKMKRREVTGSLEE